MKRDDFTADAPERDADRIIVQGPLAMAYVPMQRLGSMYSPKVALSRGTLFPALDFPLEAVKGDG